MKIEKDIEINGTPYKRITKLDNLIQFTIWQKDVPLTSPEIHASGGHTIFNRPDQDHFDHYIFGKKFGREYLTKSEDR